MLIFFGVAIAVFDAVVAGGVGGSATTSTFTGIFSELIRIPIVGDEYPKPAILNVSIPFETFAATVEIVFTPFESTICTSAFALLTADPHRHLAISRGR